MAQFGRTLEGSSRGNHTDSAQFRRMTDADISLCPIHIHGEAPVPEPAFHALDGHRRKIAGGEQIIRPKHCRMTSVIDQYRSRAALVVIYFQDSDLAVDRLAVW